MAFFPNIKTAWKRLFSDTGATLSEEYVGENAPKVVRFGLYSVVIIFVFITVLGIYWSSEPTEFNVIENDITASTADIGTKLLSYDAGGFILPFEVVSVLLLAAMIGAIVIAKGRKLTDKNEEAL